jgi:hypothetical protein
MKFFIGCAADVSCARISTMRIQILSLLALSWAFSASGSTIENFEIVNSSSLAVSGGIFTSGGGDTYSGTFQVDTSQIHPDGSRADFPLTSWDIIVSRPASQFDLEFDPANGSGSFNAQPEFNLTSLGLGFGLAQVDSIEVQRTVGEDVFQLFLSMLEPAGLFHGGVVLEATDTMTSFVGPPSQQTTSDLLGTGLVLDPAVLAPEPGCALLLAGGMGLLAALRRRLRNEAYPSSLIDKLEYRD